MAVRALPLETLPLVPSASGDLLALRPRTKRRAVAPEVARALLGGELDLVAARCLRAIAEAWDSRVLGFPGEGAHPFEVEVGALLGFEEGHAAERLGAARAHADAVEVACRAEPEHRSRRTPLGALAAELRLSPLALDVLLVVAAPALRGELARLYGILANSPGRPLCDELLVDHVLSHVDRQEIAEVLDPAGPLVRQGVVRVAAGAKAAPFAALTVDPVVLARLRGARLPAARRATRSLDEIVMPAELRARLLDALRRRPPGAPLRLVLRGREGSGRRTILAAVAAMARRPLATIDARLLPAAPALVDALRRELETAHLAGHLACVTHLDAVGGEEGELADKLREVLRRHPAPLALTARPGARPPLDPGHLAFDLPPLDESERLSFWRSALGRAGLRVRDVERLAGRYRITPGLIERAVAAVAPRDRTAIDATHELEAVIRQGLANRLGAIATHVTRLATWSSAVLEEDVEAGVRELIARVEQRRRVFEQWGFDRLMTTTRGLTALFSGGPGTGKTMVAGIIARELGLDLYRVDLSRVLSKWVGETERNLSEVFDAAEDGQAVLLFDEADALFAKRTEVESSGDRYANVVVDYLLQRLDSFDGIAILTTNAGGSIDPAFRRRLSASVEFPFPEEEMRVRLWRAHLPDALPRAEGIDLPLLARRYRMSGGSIRNAALRAAFLAAQAGTPLAQEHLEEAVQREYRDRGRLAAGGALE